MRFLLLLFVGFVPTLVLCQTVCRIDLLQTHPYDTLRKYSYLIVSMGRDRKNKKRIIPLNTGTGFFLRDEKKLYFITARHVVTGCEVYNAKTLPDIPTVVKIWYKDRSDKPAYRLIPLPDKIIKTPCISAVALADADTLNVSEYFKDVDVNTIEGFRPGPNEDHMFSPCDTVVAYGYPSESNDLDTLDIRPNLVSEGYISYSRDMPHDQQVDVDNQLFTSYFAVEPAMPPGVSGAPVFRISLAGDNGPIIRLCGIQSGTRADWKTSYIVQENVLWRDFQLKK